MAEPAVRQWGRGRRDDCRYASLKDEQRRASTLHGLIDQPGALSPDAPPVAVLELLQLQLGRRQTHAFRQDQNSVFAAALAELVFEVSRASLEAWRAGMVSTAELSRPAAGRHGHFDWPGRRMYFDSPLTHRHQKLV
jgi:hypothetical protein